MTVPLVNWRGLYSRAEHSSQRGNTSMCNYITLNCTPDLFTSTSVESATVNDIYQEVIEVKIKSKDDI